jgi:REP element-mobilizing transposase RayT
MAYRREFFEKGQPVHILSRAVEGRKIFEKKGDCYRFIFQIYASNFGEQSSSVKRKDMVKVSRDLLAGEKIPRKFIRKRHPPLVHILDFALVKNHYHFYLVPNFDNSVPAFMRRLNTGFAKYFNLKYEREGVLFATRYKSVFVKTEFQSDAVQRYINIINPLDVYQPGWRKKGLSDWQEAFEFLRNYQFSSFPDKIGERRTKILASKEIEKTYSFAKNSQDRKEYLNFIEDFLREKLASFQSLFLE